MSTYEGESESYIIQ